MKGLVKEVRTDGHSRSNSLDQVDRSWLFQDESEFAPYQWLHSECVYLVTLSWMMRGIQDVYQIFDQKKKRCLPNLLIYLWRKITLLVDFLAYYVLFALIL